MTTLETTMRPGVTADYSPLPGRTGPSPRLAAVVGSAPALTPVETPVLERFASLSAAQAVYGADAPLTAALRAVFENRPGDVAAVRINAGDPAQKQAALALLCEQREPMCIAVDDADAALLAAAKPLLAAGGKFLFAAPAAGADPAQLAEGANCERILLVAPAIVPEGDPTGKNAAPFLLAAMTARQTRPANLFGAETLGDYTIPNPLGEARINELLRRGVTVFEPGALCPECVRAVTTRTQNPQGGPDYSLRNLSAPLTVDYVTQTLCAALAQKLAEGALALSAIASLAEWELYRLREEAYLSSFEPPVVTPDPNDPSACEVGVRFTLRQSAAQIRLHILFE